MRILAALVLVAGCAPWPKPALPANIAMRKARTEHRARRAAEDAVCPRRCMRALGLPLPIHPSDLAPYAVRLAALECRIECLKERVWHTEVALSPTMSACVEPFSSSP